MAITEVVVGRIGKAHGVKGEVSVEPRTDEPERRFTVGAVLAVEPPQAVRSGSAAPPAGPLTGRPTSLTVHAVRWHQSRLLVTFAEIADRTQAEAARGLVLLTDVDADETPEDPEEFYDHQLVGLRVATTDGEAVGEIAEVVHGAAQDLLVVRTHDARDVLVPFVTALVPVVDVPGGRVEVVDQPGLLHPDEAEPDRPSGEH